MMCDTVTMQSPAAAAAPGTTHKPDCPHCASGAATGLSDAGCHGCQVREIARSPAAWRSLHGVTDVEIRDAILATYGRDGYKAGREAVWGWIKRLGLDGGAPDAQRGAR